MKKVLSLILMGLMTSCAMVTNPELRTAQSLAETNPAKAKELLKEITPKLKEAEQVELKFVAAAVENAVFQAEQKKQLIPGMGTPDQVKMNNAILDEFDNYFQLEKLDVKPNEDGKVEAKFMNKAKEAILMNTHYQELYNAAIYFYNKKDLAKSSKAFEYYVKARDLNVLKDDVKVTTPDTLLWDARRLATVVSYEAKDYDNAIRLASLYKDKQDYMKEQLYQILCVSQLSKGDTVSALKSLEQGAAIFDKSQYFLGNIVSIYTQQNKLEKAISFLNQIIEKNPNNAAYLVFMANLYEKKSDWAQSEKWYRKALEVEPDNFNANYGVALAYYNRAADLTNSVTGNVDRLTEKKVKALLTESLPFFEAAYKKDPKASYYLYANVYYSLGNSKKYEEIMAANK